MMGMTKMVEDVASWLLLATTKLSYLWEFMLMSSLLTRNDIGEVQLFIFAFK